MSFTHYHDNRIVGSVWEKHIQGYGLVSTRDLILFTFHDISLMRSDGKSLTSEAYM